MRRLLMEWALTSSLLILAVIALRALLGKRISARLRYTLWLVVLIRLLVPVQFFSLPVPAVLPDVDREPVITGTSPAAPLPQGEPMGTPAIVGPPPDGVVVTYDAAAAPSDISLNVTSLWDVLIPLWLAGSAAMAAALLFSNLAFASRLRRVRVPLEDADCPLPVYRAESLPSPCLFGLVRPTVYVTAEAAQDPVMLCHVLAHEHTHFRHGDHIWNLLRSAALAAHWWNPLVWWAAVLSRRDCELACDEGVLKRLGDGERIAYGRTLLALITARPGPGDLLRCATTMTGGQKSVFDRVARIARAPKRWLWAAVVVVLVAALASVFAFGQARDSETLPDLDADLSFSLTDDGTGVRIEGSVDGTEIQHTLWFAPAWFGSQGEMRYPLGQLWFEAPLCDRTSTLDACWTDRSKTAVKVTATPTAMLSSYSQAGNLIFTVDVSKGTLLELDGYIPKFGPGQAERVPTEEEAVRAARIAAKLLTEAEAYYQSHAGELPPLSTPEASPQSAPEMFFLPDMFADVLRGTAKFVLHENEPPIALGEVPAILDPDDSYMAPLRYTVLDLSGDRTPEVLVYVLGTAGDMAGYLLLWDEGGQIRGELFDHHDWRNRWFDDLKADGTFLCSDPLGVGWNSISRLRYTSADGWTLYSDAVYRSPESPYGAIKLEDLESLMFVERDCPEEEFQEAMELQRAKPDASWYRFPEDSDEGSISSIESAFSVDSAFYASPTFTLYKSAQTVAIYGLYCESALWYAAPLHAAFDVPERALGHLELRRPRFLGERFAQCYPSCSVFYSPEDDPNRVWIYSGDAETGEPMYCTVSLSTGAVRNRVISGVETADCRLSDAEMLQAARILTPLIQGAASYYQAFPTIFEDGPLPFNMPMEMRFSSGAGGWSTFLTLHPDGSFEGKYSDTDMADSGSAYRAIEYICNFHGRFGDIRKVTDASWSMTLEDLVIDTERPIGEEWIKGNTLYISSAPYGFSKRDDEDGSIPLQPGAPFMLYTPEASGKSGGELHGMENESSPLYGFWTWWPNRFAISGGRGGTLGCYGLRNMETGYGFFS